MGSFYATDMLDVLRAAGCTVAENDITAGWQTRARSSGGFPGAPLGVQWHHTASRTSPANDLSWQIRGSSDAPIGNVLLDRTGCYWPVAAGASNTAGKGGPMRLSRGTVGQDNANATTFAIEAANDGVGEAWPAVMIDAFFAGSNALNARWGNRPDDVFTHAAWTSRKIDPATAAAVQGPWRPRSVTSSGTWSNDDVRAECNRRAAAPAPTPDPDPEDDDMRSLLIRRQGDGALFVSDADLTFRFPLWGEDYDALVATGQYVEVSTLRDDTLERIPVRGDEIVNVRAV